MFCSRGDEELTEAELKYPQWAFKTISGISKASLLFESLLHMWIQAEILNKCWSKTHMQTFIDLTASKISLMLFPLPSRKLLLFLFCAWYHSDNRCWKSSSFGEHEKMECESWKTFGDKFTDLVSQLSSRMSSNDVYLLALTYIFLQSPPLWIRICSVWPRKTVQVMVCDFTDLSHARGCRMKYCMPS